MKHFCQSVQQNRGLTLQDIFRIILFLCLLWAGRVDAFRYVQVGESALPLVLEDLNGQEVKPSFAGKLTVLLFWRPGQSFSLQALQDLKGIAHKLQGKGVEVIPVSDPVAAVSELRELRERHGFPFSFYIDRGRRTREAYGVIVFPSTGIVDKAGRLRFYQPSRNSHYEAIIGGKLKVLLGMMRQQEFEARLTRLGEDFVGNGKKARQYYRTGLALIREGKNEAAATELSQAVSLMPTLMEAHLQLGYVLLEMEKVRAALKEFQYVKEHNPLSPSAGVGIGIAYLRLGEIDKGIRLLADAVAINPNPVRGYVELGKAYEAKGDLTNALHFYQRAVKKLLQGRR